MNLTLSSHPRLAPLVWPATIACVIAVAVLFVGFNGGIGVGASNHAGLLPVVRRLLNPNYLPGDFNISLRLYHHRIFAYLVAGLAAVFGEDHGIVVLHSIGALLIAASLWYLCRTLGLSLIGFLTVSLLIAAHLWWTGWGLEENTFIGNLEIQPPLFAHAFVLLAAAFLIQRRYRAVAVCAGLAVLFHLQIGIVLTIMVAPFFAVKLRDFGWREIARLALCYLLPALLALINLMLLFYNGVLHPSSSVYSLASYIDFRHPHHFELMSAAHGWWVGGHIAAQVVIAFLLWKLKLKEARGARVLVLLSLMLGLLSLVHFTDYYLIKQDKIANLQMVRLSPVVTVFGALCLLALINGLARMLGETFGARWLSGAASVALLILAIVGAVNEAPRLDPQFYLGVKRLSDKDNNWVRMCNWIVTNGPRDSAYLTPPAYDGFTALTDRANIVEFKINPDGASHLTEWFERLSDLTGGKLPNERGFKNRKPLNKAYGQLNEQQLIALGKKYGAHYAVVPKTSSVKFETLHENEALKLVKLPEA